MLMPINYCYCYSSILGKVVLFNLDEAWLSWKEFQSVHSIPFLAGDVEDIRIA
jgi:hypothetical protein